MSSILIKGSVMPLTCEECPCYDSNDHSCNVSGVGVAEYQYTGRPNNCPLVEIPTPHGRLIDADKLYEPMERDLYAGIGCDPTSIAAITISEAPTIIEAEVSE